MAIPLRLKIDENLPRRLQPALRAAGHDVETAATEGLSGATDPTVLAACTRENRVLVTLDLDFADIRAYPPGSHRGIWVLRPPDQSIRTVTELVHSATKLAAIEPTADRLWVIDARRVRIRA